MVDGDIHCDQFGHLWSTEAVLLQKGMLPARRCVRCGVVEPRRPMPTYAEYLRPLVAPFLNETPRIEATRPDQV